MFLLAIIGGIVITALLIVVAIISVYNRLVSLEALAQEGFSGINVQLKKRHDLVQQLVEVVKGYAAHEKSVLENVTRARTATLQAHSLEQKAQAEGALSAALKTLFAVAENYPDLKANHNFLHLQQELSGIENDLQLARRYYNGAVRNYNIVVKSFFSSFIARFAGFQEKPYFEIHQAETEVPNIRF